jgi:hypothetical protein
MLDEILQSCALGHWQYFHPNVQIPRGYGTLEQELASLQRVSRRGVEDQSTPQYGRGE